MTITKNPGVRLTTPGFITRARCYHGSKYDYSLVNYINYKIKVDIICPKHGKFQQKPSEHLVGNGCQKCGKEVARIKAYGNTRTQHRIYKSKYTYDEFISKCNEKFKNYFNYNLTKFTYLGNKIIVGCPIHGNITIKADQHLKSGCNRCNKGKPSRSVEKFIQDLKVVHGNRYDYSKIKKYKNSKDILTIVCSIHGDFQQKAEYHKNGSNCPSCAKISANNNRILTSLSKYGVEYPAQNPKIQERCAKFVSGNKKFIFPSGNIVNLQGYEPIVVQQLLDNGYKEEELLLKDRPAIKYFWNSDDGHGDNKYHYYHPDIVIPKENRIIEVKSGYTYNGNGNNMKLLSQNLAKKSACLEQGWNFEFRIINL